MMGSSSGTGSGCVVDGPRDLGQVRFGQTKLNEDGATRTPRTHGCDTLDRSTFG